LWRDNPRSKVIDKDQIGAMDRDQIGAIDRDQIGVRLWR